MKIQITMWGPHNRWKGLVASPGKYSIRGITGSATAIAVYKNGENDVTVDIPADAAFLPTNQPSGKAYRPEDNEYDPAGTYWQRVK